MKINSYYLLKAFTVLVLFAMFLIFMSFISKYGDELKKDPCSVCAARMKGNVYCTITSEGGTASRMYIWNGSIIDAESRNPEQPLMGNVNYSELLEDEQL